METKEIQKLIDFISKSDLDEVNIKTAELELKIKRNTESKGKRPMHASQQQSDFAPEMNMQSAPYEATSTFSPSTTPAPTDTSNLLTITSPMIGTFYRSGGPDKPNFVDIGDEVENDSVVCIIEAMKLFNEIEAEISGKIVKVLVEDATPVEFDQPLFLVEPS